VSIPISVVDAFTSEPFRGNPAAVCVLEQPAEVSWMQQVAAELNLSETAFLVARTTEPDAFDLRWFTPKVEVALCGHATLASAHLLWESGRAQGDDIRFSTKSGVLTAARRGATIELDFPAKPAEVAVAPPGLVEALGCAPLWVGKSAFDYLVLVDSEATVRALAPDHARLRALPVRGVIVTAAHTGDFDFVSRFFAPGAGVDEDPVTGSAHCTLAPFWSARTNKTTLRGHQVSARGGVVDVRLAGDRVVLGGRAVTMWRGELLV
jgi:predicted PhzF superfamily epimerase YddE/YHI9